MPELVSVLGDLGYEQVKDAVDWVAPETYGAIGNGDAANADADTAALQSAINTGKPVMVSTGKNYRINAELMPPVGKDLVILGMRNTGSAGATLTAVSSFTGYMLRPRAGYDIRDVKLTGNDQDGCYLIGSADDSAAGLARLERIYFSNADIGVYFGGQWEHPWGLYYNQLVGVNFNTGGINLGGVSGAASSGESAWSMDNINMIGQVTGNGIPAPSQAVSANTPNATSDTITWDNSSPPLYGWCVMRSANGTTGWHVPPNWTSSGLDAASFVATKTSGETWYYKVVRMTRGLHIRRAKAIAIAIAQLEYFGIGVYAKDVSALDIAQYYGETRDRSPNPLPMFAGIYGDNSLIGIGGGWCEQFGYGTVSWANSLLSIYGSLRLNNCKWGKGGRGGSTAQAIFTTGELRATGTTPNTIVAMSGSAYDYAGAGIEFDSSSNKTVSYVDGADGNEFSARRRGVTKGRLFVNASGEGALAVDRASVTQPNKTLTPPILNTANYSTLTAGSATGFMTISGLPNNSLASLAFLVHIGGIDGSSVRRQSCVCRVEVALVEAAGTGVTSAIVAGSEAKAIQAGTMGTPAFTASVSSGVVTLSCNIASSMTDLRLYPSLLSATGPGASSLVITQL